MTWELLRHGRWYYLLALSTAISLPAFIVFALRIDGPLSADDAVWPLISFHLLSACVFIIGAITLGFQSPVAHLFAYPLRTSTLVAWRLIPGLLLVAAQMAISLLTLNWLLDLQWPVWGPTMLAAAGLAMAQAAAWLTEKSVGWLLIAMTLVGAVLGLWFKSRFGTTFGEISHGWQSVTPSEVFTLLAATAAAFSVGVVAVQRNRCGLPPLSVGFLDWLNSLLESFRGSDRPLRSPMEAQLWLEWTRKGWVLPATVIWGMACFLVIWTITSLKAADLFDGLFMGGGLLSMAGFFGGLMLGNVGANDANYAMNQFFATRPMTDADLGRVMLRTAAKSVFIGWLIWATGFAIACLGLVVVGGGSAIRWPTDMSWMYAPATLLGPWMMTSVLMSVGLLGRTRAFQVATFLPMAFILLTAICRVFLTPEVAAVVAQVVAFAISAGGMAGIACAFHAARRRGLIATSTVWAVAALWLSAVVVAGINLQLPAHTGVWLPLLMLAAVVGLALLPLALVPLAITWSRHR